MPAPAGPDANGYALLRGVIDAGFDSFAIARAVRAPTGEITDFAIVDLNRRAASMVGRSRESLLGQSLLDIFPNSRAWRLWEQLCAVLLTQRPFETTQHAPTPEDRDRWLQRQLVPLPGEAIAISSRDVTERHRARRALEVSEARSRQLFEHPSCVQLLVDRDSSRILEANGAAEQFYGWSRTTLCAMSVTDLESVGLEFWRAHTAPTSVKEPVLREHRLADGSRRQVGVQIGEVVSAGATSLHYVVQDLEALATANRRWHDGEARFRALIAGMREGVVLHDADGTIRLHNPAAERILGLTGAQLTGLQPVNHNWQAEDETGAPWPTVQHPAMEALRTGRSQPRRIMRIVQGAEQTTWLTVSADALIRPGETVPYAAIAVFADITESREASDRAADAHEREVVARIAGRVGHDLNNVLTVIRAASTFLADAVGVGSAQAEDLAAIERATDRGESLTRRLLAAGRTSTTDSEPLDVQLAVHQWRDGLMDNWASDLLVTSPESDVVAASVDSVRLREVLETLVRQARLATDASVTSLAAALPSAATRRGTITMQVGLEHTDVARGGTVPAHIAMRAPRTSRFATIRVHDSGDTISDALRMRLADAVFDPDGADRARELELAVLHTLMRQTGGSVTAYSDATGNVVVVAWPAAELPGTGATSGVEDRPGAALALQGPRHAPGTRAYVDGNGHDIPEAVGAAVRRGSILLVDDDERLRDLGRRMLERAGDAVYTAATGREALTFLRARAADVGLVITDLTMPDMGGLELIERMATEFPDIPTVAVSGYVVNPQARELLASWHVPYVQKPFTNDTLLAAMAQARTIWASLQQ